MSIHDQFSPARDTGGLVCRFEPEPDRRISFVKVSSEYWAPGHAIRHRRRPDYALLLIREGAGRLFVDDDAWSVGPGRACVLAPGHPHELRADSDVRMRVWRLTVAGRGVAKLLREQLGSATGVWNYPAAAAEQAAAMLRLAVAGGPCLHETLIAHYRCVIMLMRRERESVPVDPFVQTAREALRSNFGRPDPVRRAAERCGCSPEHLSRRYRAACGESPRECVERLRCQEAQELLRESDLSLTVIGQQLGYADAFAFSKAFKRWCGQAPSVWRCS